MIKIQNFIINPETLNVGEIRSWILPTTLNQDITDNEPFAWWRISDFLWIIQYKSNLKTGTRITVGPENPDELHERLELECKAMAEFYHKTLKNEQRQNDLIIQGNGKKRRSRPGKVHRMANKKTQDTQKVESTKAG